MPTHTPAASIATGEGVGTRVVGKLVANVGKPSCSREAVGSITQSAPTSFTPTHTPATSIATSPRGSTLHAQASRPYPRSRIGREAAGAVTPPAPTFTPTLTPGPCRPPVARSAPSAPPRVYVRTLSDGFKTKSA